MTSDIRRLADLAGVTLTEHTLPPARAIHTTITAVGLGDQSTAVVEAAVKHAVSQLSIAVSDYKVDRSTGSIVVYPKIIPQGISTQALNESKEELIRILSSRSTVRRAERVSEGAVKENLNTRAIKIPLNSVGLEHTAIPDVQLYVDAAVEAQDVLDIDNWEISHFTDLLFYCVGDEPAAAKIRSFGKAMVAYLTDPENVNGTISATGDEEKEDDADDEVYENLTEISTDLRDRYVDRANSAFGHYNMARRNTQGEEQKYFAHREERRRKGISRALSDKRLGREKTTEGSRGDYGYPSFSVAKAQDLVASGNWEAMSDIVPGKHVEMRNTRTGKRTTVQITESVVRSNLGAATKSGTRKQASGGRFEAVHESHVSKSGTTNVFGYIDLTTGTTTLTHTVDGTLTESAVKRHLQDVRFPLN